MNYYPGRVTNASLLAARLQSARMWDWMRDTSSFPYDQDITATYYDTLVAHSLHAMSGINTGIVLWGDSQWFTNQANSEVFQMLTKCVHYAKMAQEQNVRKMVFSSHIYDTARGELHDVSRKELISTQTSMLQNCLPAADNRSILVVRIHMAVGDYDCHMDWIVPPPIDNCAWDAHAYMRSPDETIMPMNMLLTSVFHVSGAERPNDEVLMTCQRLRQKVCAPIPNSQSAMHLLAALRVMKESPPAAPGGAEWNRHRTEELLEELKAMEGELVSVRAAYMSTNERCQALEVELGRADPNASKRLPLDPAAVNREQLRVSEELLRRLNVDYQDMNRRLGVIERAINVGADLRLRALLQWRQQENEILLQRLSEAHLHFVSGQIPRSLPTNLAVDMRPTGGPVGVTPSMQRALGEMPENAGGHVLTNGAVGNGRNVAMNRVAATQGSQIAVDPLTLLYQGRLVELEDEVSKMADVDIKACVDEYYIQELDRMERELAEWVAKCSTLEAKKALAEQALRTK